MNEELKAALKVIVLPILSRGEVKDSNGCLLPDVEGQWGEASQYLHKTFNATHFSREWEVPLKSVKITLFEGEAFGAVLATSEVVSFIVDVDADYFKG